MRMIPIRDVSLAVTVVGRPIVLMHGGPGPVPAPAQTAPKTAASAPIPVTAARPHQQAETAGVLTGA
jgi:hypothetical protein